MRHLLPLGYVGLYAVAIGLSTFLEKPATRFANAYALNALIAVGAAIVAVALWLVFKPTMPSTGAWLADLGLGVVIGVGSLFYFFGLRHLPVNIAGTVANTYILLTVALSVIFLHENLTWMKGLGIALTIAGVLVLSFQK